MGAGSHWLPGASLLAGTGEARGEGPLNLTLLAGLLQGAWARSCLPIKAGQTMPEMQGHMLPGYCSRERERRPGKPAPSASPGPAGTWSHCLAAAAQYHTGTPSCRGMNPFRPVSTHPSRSVRRQPHPFSAPTTGGGGLPSRGGGSPRNKAREPGVWGGLPEDLGGTVAVSLLALLVLQSFSLSAL